MSLFDRVRSWMRGEAPKRPAQPARSQAQPSTEAARELTAFIQSRRGVEAFLEPRTAIYSNTLLLVADDGEYLRRPIGGPQDAKQLCTKLDVPLYDAAKVGYPKRMRDYDLGARPKPVELTEMPPWPTDDPPEVGGDGPPPPPQG